MARRRETPEIFSLSFLDLICCGMGGVLVLYSVADQGSDTSRDRANRSVPRLVQLEFPQRAGRPLFTLSIENGTHSHIIRSSRAAGDWLESADPAGARVRLFEEFEPGAILLVTVEDFDPAWEIPKPLELMVQVLAPSGTGQLIMHEPQKRVLNEDNHFRLKLSLPALEILSP